jgi:uncharacterized membrane protein YbhN (UPF0104 family)
MVPIRSKKYQLILSLVFLLALIYFLSKLRFDVVFQEISSSNKLFLSLGVISLILAATVKIFRFSMVTKTYHYPISLLEASLIQMVGISFAILTPARIGEGSKAVLLNKRLDVPMTSSMSIVLFERFFDLIFLSTIAFLFSIFLLQDKITVLIGLFVLALLGFFTIFLKYFNAFKNVIPEKYRNYFTDVKLRYSPFSFLSILLVTALTWSLQAGLPWFTALSLGVSVPYLTILGIVCIGVITILFSILPTGLGAMDLSYLFLYTKIGISIETAFSILVIHRLFDILVPFLFALFLINYHQLSIKEIKHLE